MNYIFSLLPAWLQALIRPEIHHLVDSFQKLEAKLSTVQGRKAVEHATLVAVKAEIENAIVGTKAEIERAERIATRLRDLVA